MRETLLSLFSPPKDCFGDFGLFCGFTATKPVLQLLRNNFAGEMNRPVLAAFIHPTIGAVPDVLQLAWMWMKHRDYNLLHAKVALLGFRHKPTDGYVIRLAVSTGNWTRQPLTDSIDLFWSIDVNTANPEQQDVADLRAAWSMFDWLRARADCSLIENDFDGHPPDARLREAIERLPTSTLRPRFIDSRTQPLFAQVIERLAGGKRADRLILGSGYHEAEGDGDAGLPERLHDALVKARALGDEAALDLFLNPQACQGLAARAAALTNARWKLRPARSKLHGDDARLHAKFVALGSGEREFEGRLYLGSGNLSRNGFEKAANGGGNLEAGVVLIVPEGRRLEDFLPVQFTTEAKLHALSAGEKFEPPEPPPDPPPVSWLLWDAGQLKAPQDLSVEVIAPDGRPLATPCEWPAPAPAFVTLALSGWRLPVIAEGVLVTLRPSDLTVEDILAGLPSFPEPAERDRPDDGAAGAEPMVGAMDTDAHQPATYAIRRMMELIVRLSETQQRVDLRDWQRWCRELRLNLAAIAAKETAMLDFFRQAGANPLPALAEPIMCPKDADIGLLNVALMEVAKVWDLAGLPSLWEKEVR